jgi:predicted dehydrogenase
MKRRQFLRHSVAAATTLGLATYVPAQAKGANDRIVLALIGCGGRGTSTITDCAKNNPNVTIKTVCDVNRTKLAQFVQSVEKNFGNAPKPTEEMRDIFADKDVDAAWIATPEHWHCLAGIWACQAGKDVYVEKNVSVNIWESRKLAEAAKKYNRIVQVGLQNRSAESGATARQYIKDGKLGNIVTVKTYFMLGGGAFQEAPTAPVPGWLDWDKWLGPAPWREYSPSIVSESGRGGWQNYWAYSGGKLDDEASHTIDFTMSVLDNPGHPKSVYAWGSNHAWGGKSEVPEFQSIVYDFGTYTLTADGGTAFPYMAKNPPSVRNDKSQFPNWRNFSAKVEIYGTKGLMFLGRHGGGWQVLGKDDKIVEQDGQDWPDKAHQKNFIDCIRSRQAPNGDIAACHYSSTLVNLGNIAYRCGNKLLQFDGEKEQFIGNDEANQLARGTYRKGYEIPENV